MSIAVTAPVRVDLVGGITDVPELSQLVGTDITNIAIDMFVEDSAIGIEVWIGASSDGGIVVQEVGRSAQMGAVAAREVDFPRRIVEAALPTTWASGADVIIRNDLPRRTGLGASSSLAVCLTAGVDALTTAQPYPGPDCHVVVKQAHHGEVVKAGIVGGCQDFIAAFFGGVNRVTFSDLAATDLSRQRGLLGVAVPDDLRRYLDDNLIVVVRRESAIGSDAMVNEHKQSLATRPAVSLPHLRRIKNLNAEVFPLLTQRLRTLDDRLKGIGAAMTTSWDTRKQLSSRTGSGILADIETAVRTWCLGIHGPGSGVNSLLLLAAPYQRDRVVDALETFRPDIDMFQAKINTTGTVVRRQNRPILIRGEGVKEVAEFGDRRSERFRLG